METLRWREFEGLPDDTVMVTVWETPIGKTCTPANSKHISSVVVPHSEAVSMLRASAT